MFLQLQDDKYDITYTHRVTYLKSPGPAEIKQIRDLSAIKWYQPCSAIVVCASTLLMGGPGNYMAYILKRGSCGCLLQHLLTNCL